VKLIVHLKAFTNSISASQKTHSKPITKTNRLVAFFTINTPPPTPHCREPANPQLLNLFLIHFSIIMASKLRSSGCYPPSSFPVKLSVQFSDFGGLEVTCWPLVHKFAGSHPAEAKKNPQHAFLRRGSKAVRRSHVVALRHVKDPQNVTRKSTFRQNLPDISHPQFHLPPLGAIAW
jgi:hypothetical protein